MSEAVRAVVIGVVVVLLGVSPVHGQPDPERDTSVRVTGQADLPLPDGHGDSHGDTESVSDCHELYALGEWDESEFVELLECVFGLSASEAHGPSSQDGVSGAQDSASDCGDVSVEYAAQQYLPRTVRYFGFPLVIGHMRIYLMYLTCEDGSPAVGYSTGLQETWGPNSSRTSEFCWVPNPNGRGVLERETSRANGCPSFIGGIPDVAVSAHLHLISNSRDNRIRQVVMWADLNRNSQHDIGEPYDTAYSPDDIGSNDFSLRRVSGGLVGRPGQLALLNLQLTNDRGLPLKNTSVGAAIVSGTSTGATISCFKPLVRTVTASRGSDCATDGYGNISLVYMIGTRNISSSHQNMDVIRVHIDRTNDGRLNFGEPFRYVSANSTRAVTYVALGDSYTSGENGEDDDLFFEGSYLTINPADSECKRWNMAYPFLVGDFLAGTGLNITTYACTGAITRNIYDDSNESNTDRPSRFAKEFPNDRWEPRQAVSLERLNRASLVDMVTITIGGNDVRFDTVLRQCYTSGCDESDLRGLSSIKENIRSVLNQLKVAAPEASIFILGYPYVTPESVPDNCRGLTIEPIIDSIKDDLEPWEPGSLLDTTEEKVGELIDEVLDKSGPFAFLLPIPMLLLANLARDWTDNIARVASYFGLAIDDQKSQFLRNAATNLNDRIREAASNAGAHYVPVASEFEGHSPCASATGNDWIYGLEGQSIPGQTTNRTVLDLFEDSFEDFVMASVSFKSFHPNADGYRAYARILSEYIEEAVSLRSFELNEAGLPVNPTPTASTDSSLVGSTISSSADSILGDLIGTSGEEADLEEDDSIGVNLLRHRRTALGKSDCNASLLVFGDRLELSAEGFAPNSVVKLSAAGKTVSALPLSPTVTMLPSVTADVEGRIKTVWTIPDAPESQEGSAPRLYLVMAGGTDVAGDALAAVSFIPIVTYPAIKPCARDDSVATSLSRSIRIPILANDIAPQGGTLNPASVKVDPVYGGDFSLNTQDGSLTFTPIPGFTGTVTTGYQVYDNWGMRIRAEIIVTVNAGCTITGTAGVVNIVGTDGDDVICVPDSSDPLAFHIIDAKGGNDVILGGDGVDWVYGGHGRDIVYSRYGKDLIDGGAEVDTIYSGGSFDSIYSTDLNDIIIDNDDGYELILAPATVTEDVGPVVVDDWLHFNVSEPVVVHVLDNDHDPNGDLDSSKLSITHHPASGSARVVTSDEYGAAIEYTATTAGSDELTYKICDSYERCTAGQVNITAGDEICTILGTSASETLRGTSEDDVICGLGGNDVILGGDGDDIIIGGSGDDTLSGGDGADILWGGVGNDRLTGGTGSDILWGGDGDDILDGNTQNDALNGGPGNDTLYGSGHNDELLGNSGDDELYGGPGDDAIYGDLGEDTIDGGNGDDYLNGGSGKDSCRRGEIIARCE